MANNKKPKTSYIFPGLNQRVADAVAASGLSPTWANKTRKTANLTKEKNTYIMGNFTCRSKGCGQWKSGKVAIVIKGSPDGGRYHAEVFGQRCRACNQLGDLEMDEDVYVERVAYRLKVFAGVPVEEAVFFKKPTKPHVCSLCEGCKRGICECCRT